MDLAREKSELIAENALLRMDKRRSISSAIMIANSDPVSLEQQSQVASRYLKHRIRRHEPMRSVNAFWGAFGEHVLILHEKQLHRVLQAFVEYFNQARPHQGIRQQVPQGEVTTVPADQRSHRIISVPILGGLRYEYRRVA